MNKVCVLRAAAGLLLAVTGMSGVAKADNYPALFDQRYSSPEDISVLGSFVAKAVEVGQYDQAISTLEQHLVKYPRDARAKYTLAKVYANTGSWELMKRNATDALEIGDLTPEEIRDAEALIARANNSLAGFEWALDATVGIKSTWLETDAANPDSGWRDRQDWNPYFAANGSLRIDLNTPLNDALIVSSGVLFERRYEDINLGGFNPFPDFSNGGVYLHNRGYVAMTLDKGIETTSLDALRLQVGVFGNWRSLNPSVHDAALGTVLRLIIQPTVDMTAFMEGKYSSLFPAENVVADHRFEAAAGFTRRLSHEHSVGIAARYIHEITDSGVTIADQREVELRYSGLLPYRPFGTVWTQQAGVAFGDFETLDTSGLPFFVPPRSEGRFIKANWIHTFQIDGYNSISVSYEFKQFDFDNLFLDNFFIPTLDGDYSTHSVGVSYTKSF